MVVSVGPTVRVEQEKRILPNIPEMPCVPFGSLGRQKAVKVPVFAKTGVFWKSGVTGQFDD